MVGNLQLNTGDQAIKDRLEAMGYAVDTITFVNATTADAAGKSVVFISATGNSNDLGATFKDVSVGVVVCEGFIFDDMGFTGLVKNEDYGALPNQTEIAIVDNSHPLAAGLSGIVTVVDNDEGFFIWGLTGGAAAVVGELTADPFADTIFAYEQGQNMAGGDIAAQRRVGLFLGDFTAAHFTAQGWQLFEAAVQWAASAN